MNITLVRHPQTTANNKHVIYGRSDYPYTKCGQDQFLWIKDYMVTSYGLYSEGISSPRIKVLSSPRGRALNLATKISEKLEIDLETFSDISEMDFGIFEGLTMEEVMETYPDDYKNFQESFDTTRIPEGESYNDFTQRVDRFFEYLENLNKEVELDEVIIVSHGGVIRELLERLLGTEPGDSWKLLIGNGCIIKLVERKDSYQLRELIANKF